MFAAAPAQASPGTAETVREDAIPWGLQPKVMPALPAPVWVSTILRAREATWRCQARAELPRTRAGTTRAELRHAGSAYRAWVLTRWGETLSGCEAVAARTIPATNDWATAVRVVQRAFPGSDWWLLACSSSEGGHGLWKFRNDVGALTPERLANPPNVPGGPMQYFRSTWESDFGGAMADLRARGFRVPASAFSWFSQLGQAVAAGWAYNHARPSGKWTGYRC